MNKKKYVSPALTVTGFDTNATLLAGTIIPSGLGTSVPEGTGAYRSSSVYMDWEDDEEE